MDIHSIFSLVSPFFRGKRMRVFLEILRPGPDDAILDVGGTPSTWTPVEKSWKSVDLVNIRPAKWTASDYDELDLSPLQGNGCDLDAEDDSYDIVFSNSVIEHVSTWENQQNFANEVRRVGRKLWIQTPAREFFFEPHYLGPFVHWLPSSVRRKTLRWLTPWGWIARPDQAKVDEFVDEIRLLSKPEMEQLFPDCQIYQERFLWLFTKSYTAFRL